MIEKDIFMSAVVEKLNLLEYCLLSLEFEAEKAGLDLEMSDEEVEKLEENLSNIDAKLYGGLIKDNPEEVVISYEYLYGTYLVKKDLFTAEQNNRYEQYLEKVKLFLPNHYQFVKKQKTPQIEGAYLKYDLQRSDYILGFNMLIDAFGSMHHIVKSDQNA
jgi:hypothetical protein